MMISRVSVRSGLVRFVFWFSLESMRWTRRSWRRTWRYRMVDVSLSLLGHRRRWDSHAINLGLVLCGTRLLGVAAFASRSSLFRM